MNIRVFLRCLKDNLEYKKTTGLFIWRYAPVRKRVGKVAGHKCKKGYVSIRLNGKLYKASRLAWLYCFGAWPTGVIDHIDGVNFNDRIDNLRDVSQGVNVQNQRKERSRAPGQARGVHKSTNGKRFIAQISINKKTKYIGMFDDLNAASIAYLEAKRRLHPGCTI